MIFSCGWDSVTIIFSAGKCSEMTYAYITFAFYSRHFPVDEFLFCFKVSGVVYLFLEKPCFLSLFIHHWFFAKNNCKGVLIFASCVTVIDSSASQESNTSVTRGCYLAGQFYPAGKSWHPYLPPSGFELCAVCTCDVWITFLDFAELVSYFPTQMINFVVYQLYLNYGRLGLFKQGQWSWIMVHHFLCHIHH